MYNRAQKASLFRFECSLQSINLSDSNSNNTNKHDQYGTADNATDRVLIEPNARLVIEIYQPLMAFVQEIEIALGCSTQGFVLLSVEILENLLKYFLLERIAHFMIS